MTDRRFFTPDALRAQAVEIRRLLLRLENGDGEDRDLGADILLAVDAPMTIGDPTGQMDSAYHLASFLKQPTLNLHVRCGQRVRSRIEAGNWKTVDAVTNADIARQTTIIVLKVHLANLERAPA